MILIFFKFKRQKKRSEDRFLENLTYLNDHIIC